LVCLTSIVHEDCAKVTNNVDDKENGTVLALHRKVAAASIARHWVGRSERAEALVDYLCRSKRVAAGISRERKCQENDEQNDGVDVVSQKGGLDSSEHGVDDNTKRQEETGCCGRHTSQRGDDGRSSSEQHGGDENVGKETERDVHEMGGSSISSLDSFQECLSLLATKMSLRGHTHTCAFGALLFNSIATVANNRICTVAPEAYQKGPETPTPISFGCLTLTRSTYHNGKQQRYSAEA
jgi:hypothetical protein